VGGCKDFDPEIYRQQIRSYNVSKVSAPRKAYTGAGDILHHAGGSRPESQQARSARHLSEKHSDFVQEAEEAAPPSEVPPTDLPPLEATLACKDD
jgi:hypothetical protein